MNASPSVPSFDVLRRNAWFAALPTSLQESIVRDSTIRAWRRGEALQREGEPIGALGIVLSGRIRCVMRGRRDRESLVHVGGVGCVFGWGLVQPDVRALLTVTADTSVRALVLPRAAFERLVEADPRNFRGFAALPLELMRTLFRYLGELPGLPLDGQLRVRLADLAARVRAEHRVDGPIELVLSQADLATMVGMSRQRLNQRLGELQQQGLVHVGFRRIVVPDPERLRASADDVRADVAPGHAAPERVAPARAAPEHVAKRDGAGGGRDRRGASAR